MRNDAVFRFGGRDDGVIGIPCITDDGHVVEASYFFGKGKPKSIICISSQVSCPMRCAFCELGSEKFVRNLSPEEMHEQVVMIWSQFNEEDRTKLISPFSADRPFKITIANSGEPLLNPKIVEAVALLSVYETSFKVSTVMPKGNMVKERIASLAEFASKYSKPIQLQVSLISTVESERLRLSGGGAADFATVRNMAELWREKNPSGRKVNLSLIITENFLRDMSKVADLFPSELFRFRFREYVPTRNGKSNDLVAVTANTLASIKDDFRTRGYEVFDDASPTAIERRFGLVANSIRRMYNDMTK